jgi:hypothetical protein
MCCKIGLLIGFVLVVLLGQTNQINGQQEKKSDDRGLIQQVDNLKNQISELEMKLKRQLSYHVCTQLPIGRSTAPNDHPGSPFAPADPDTSKNYRFADLRKEEMGTFAQRFKTFDATNKRVIAAWITPNLGIDEYSKFRTIRIVLDPNIFEESTLTLGNSLANGAGRCFIDIHFLYQEIDLPKDKK